MYLSDKNKIAQNEKIGQHEQQNQHAGNIGYAVIPVPAHYLVVISNMQDDPDQKRRGQCSLTTLVNPLPVTIPIRAHIS